MDEYLLHYILAHDKVLLLERLILELENKANPQVVRNLLLPYIETAPESMKEFLMELAFETQKTKELKKFWELKLFLIKEGKVDLAEHVHELIKDSIVKDTSIYVLANWCNDIDRNGTGWDDWDENYKDASFRIQGPFRQDFEEALSDIVHMYNK